MSHQLFFEGNKRFRIKKTACLSHYSTPLTGSMVIKQGQSGISGWKFYLWLKKQ